MRYVVGYGPDQRGVDGVNLASTLARSRGATLDLATVLPSDAPSFHIYSPDEIYNTRLEEQARTWLDEAVAKVPDGLSATGQIRRADTITQGLIDAATDPEAGDPAELIVVGTKHKVKTGGLRLGSLADALLHLSPVPVALAPADCRLQDGVGRITLAVGAKPGFEELLACAVDWAAASGAPLRLMTLVAVGEGGTDEQHQEWVGHAQRHVQQLIETARTQLPAGATVTAEVGTGDSLVEAVGDLDFQEDEVVMLGSSRLAQPKRLFLGSSATHIMRALEVPMILVPREYASGG